MNLASFAYSKNLPTSLNHDTSPTSPTQEDKVARKCAGKRAKVKKKKEIEGESITRIHGARLKLIIWPLWESLNGLAKFLSPRWWKFLPLWRWPAPDVDAPLNENEMYRAEFSKKRRVREITSVQIPFARAALNSRSKSVVGGGFSKRRIKISAKCQTARKLAFVHFQCSLIGQVCS